MIIRRFLIIAAFMAITINGFGQTFAGVKFGLNATKSIFNEEYKEFHTSKWKPGFTAGMIFLIQNKEKYGLWTELNYTLKGRSVDSKANDYISNSASYNYIDLPVMFRLRFKKSKYYSVYIQAGPELGYWFGGKGVAERLSSSTGFVDQYDYKINFGEFVPDDVGSMYISGYDCLQIGFVASVGAVWEMRNANYFALDFRFSMGHSNMGDKNGGEIPTLGLFDNFESTNNVITVSGIYYFNILEKFKHIKKGR